MRTLIKGNDCNSCVAFRCKKISSEFPKFRTKHKLHSSELACMECTGYLEPKPWKVPLLLHLATDTSKVQAMNDLLTQFGFRLRERTKYPYFRLQMKKGR